MLKKYKLPANPLSSIILIEENTCFTESTAVLRIAKKLPRPWPMLYIFIIIPPFIRDRIYTFVARNRYKWFGKSEKCRVATPDILERSL